MTKQVRCISPHGGGHNGIRNDNHHAVHLVWDPEKKEHVLPEIPPEKLFKPPNPGGYVMDARIPGGYAAVGQVYDVPDDFYADGFHWEQVTPPAAPPAPPRTTPQPATPKPAEE